MLRFGVGTMVDDDPADNISRHKTRKYLKQKMITKFCFCNKLGGRKVYGKKGGKGMRVVVTNLGMLGKGGSWW